MSAQVNQLSSLSFNDRSMIDQTSRYVDSKMAGRTLQQGVLTVKAKTDPQRMNYRRQDGPNRYPGGGRAEWLMVHEFEPVITPKGDKKQGAQHIVAFSSLNGLPFGDADTVEGLENLYYCSGVALSDYVTVEDPARGLKTDRTGYAVQVFGTSTIRAKFGKEICAGDKVIWRFPGVREAKQLTQTASTSQRAKEKLTVILEPLDWSTLKFQIANIARLFLLKANDLGISHRLGYGYDPLSGGYRSGITRSLASTNQYAANALRTHALTVVAKGVEVLNNRGIVKIMTPQKKKIESTKEDLLKALLNNPDVKDLISANEELNGFLQKYNEARKPNSDTATDAISGLNVDLKEAFSKDYIFFTAGGAFKDELRQDQTITSKDIAAKKIQELQFQKADEALFIASLFGVVDSGMDPKLGEKTVFDVLNATHNAFSPVGTKENYITGKNVPNLNELLSQGAPRYLKALEEYQRVSEAHIIQLSTALSEMSEIVRSKVIGTALSYAPAGALDVNLDILLGVGK